MKDKYSHLPRTEFPYKDTMNRWYRLPLFYEDDGLGNPKKRPFKPPFTKLEARPGYICFKDTFVSEGDPTGYNWAVKYLGSYQHWEDLMKSPWFVELYNTCLRELHAKMRGEALRSIQDISENASSDSQRMAASKYLAERPYEQADINKAKRKAGRPSKAEQKGHLKELVQASEQTQEEFNRLGLTLVKK